MTTATKSWICESCGPVPGEAEFCASCGTARKAVKEAAPRSGSLGRRIRKPMREKVEYEWLPHQSGPGARFVTVALGISLLAIVFSMLALYLR